MVPLSVSSLTTSSNMTKKDYQQIADVLAFTQNEVMKGRLADDAVVPFIADRLADYFQYDNSRFNRERFIAEACI